MSLSQKEYGGCGLPIPNPDAPKGAPPLSSMSVRSRGVASDMQKVLPNRAVLRSSNAHRLPAIYCSPTELKGPGVFANDRAQISSAEEADEGLSPNRNAPLNSRQH